MLVLKDSTVNPDRLKPELLLALIIADQIYSRAGHSELVITSLNDAQHKPNSLHYEGLAADIRTWGVDGEATAQMIHSKLNSRYQVLFEGDHIHIEYDPPEHSHTTVYDPTLIQ